MSHKIAASPGSSYSNETAEVIKELMLESSELTEELQELLNTQAAQLFGETSSKGTKISNDRKKQKSTFKTRKGGVQRTRTNLQQTMSRLEEVTTALADTLKQEVDIQTTFVAKMEQDSVRIGKLQERVRFITQDSEEAQKLQSVLLEEQDVDNEIEVLKKRLEELQKQKKQLKLKRDPLQSVISAQTSSYRGELAQIQTRQQAALAAHFARQQHPPPQVRVLQNATGPEAQTAVTGALDAVVAELEAVTEQYARSVYERDALRDGVVVWQDVCQIIGAMEDSVAKTASAFVTGGSIGEIPSETMAKALLEAHTALTRHFELARRNNWMLLMAAISCELEAVSQALEVVQGHSDVK